MECTISKEDIVIPEYCPLLDIPIHRCERGKGYNTPSLDRIDNTKGYIKGNVWVISKLANSLKNFPTAWYCPTILTVMGTSA